MRTHLPARAPRPSGTLTGTLTSRRTAVALGAAVIGACALSASAVNVTDTWLSAGNGTWTDATKWSAGVPNNAGASTFSVTIGATGSAYTVTLNSTITVSDLTLNSANATLNLTGTLSVVNSATNISAGTFQLNGGLISGGSITLAGGTILFTNNSGNRLANNALLNGDLNLNTASGVVRFQSGANFSGNATLSSSSNVLAYEQTLTVDNKTINLDGTSAVLAIDGSNTLTLGTNGVVRGRGNVGPVNFVSGTNGLVNNGRISADLPASTLTVNPVNLTNNGTLEAKNGASLTVGGGTTWTNAAAGTLSVADATSTFSTAGTWSNAGAIRLTGGTFNFGGTVSIPGLTANFARTGGTVNMTGTFNNAGNTLSFTATTGDWNLLGGVINGGTITNSGGNLIFTNNSGNRLANNALLNGDLNLNTASGVVRFQSGANFSGNATLSSSSNVLAYEQTLTVDNKTINLDGTSAVLAIDGSNTLTLGTNGVVRGRGNVGPVNFVSGTNGLVNNGRISADLPASTLTVNPVNLTNNGTLEAKNGASLTVGGGTTWTNAAAGTLSVADATSTFGTAGTWSNAGAIRLTGGTFNFGGTVSIPGLTANFARTGGTVNMTGTFNNAGNTLSFTATTGDWNLLGGVINGGTITNSGGNLIFTNNSGNRLANNALLNGDLNLNTASGVVRFQSGANFSGNATLSSSSNVLAYEQTLTVDNKTINLDGTSAVLAIDGSNTLTLGTNGVVRGRGNVGPVNFVSGTNGLVNNGRISADLPASTLTVNPVNLTNNGTLEAKNGASLTVGGGTTWTNAAAGTLSVADATSTFSTAGTWSNAGAIRLTGGTFNFGGTVSIPGLTANFARTGGTVNMTGTFNNAGNTLSFTATTGDWNLLGGVINGGTITNSGGNLIFTNNSGNRLANNALLNGDLNLNTASGVVRFQSGANFSGNATLSSSSNVLAYEQTLTVDNKTINLDGTSAVLAIDGSNTLTLGTNGVVRGRGNVGPVNFVSGTNGLVNNGRISADLPASTLTVNPVNLTNNGTLEAKNGGTLSLGTFTNGTGLFQATTGGKVIVASLGGNLNNSSADGLNSLLRFNGTYTINQPLPITNRATLNLRGNWTKAADIDASGRIIFDYPTLGPDLFATIRAQIITGRNGGLWNGPGIFSTGAASTPRTAVGYGRSTILGAAGGFFSGESADATAVLVRWTWVGDANLDGDTDGVDIGTWATNFTGELSGGPGSTFVWTQGDWDYDGDVDGVDAGLWATAFTGELSGGGLTVQVSTPLNPEAARILSDLGVTVVPEPVSLVTAIGLSAACLRRRRTCR